MPQNSWDLTPWNDGNRGSHELNHEQRTPPKDHRIKEVSRRLRGQDHPQRGTRYSPMIPSKKSREKPSQICGINRRTKTPKRHQKDPRKSQLRIFYTTKKDSYKVYLASSTSIPLSRSHHKALKLVLWKS
jgi:hypothetical protein